MPPIVQHRRGTLASLTAANEIPNAGEIYFETDTNKLKVGDGTTRYNSLPYIVGGAGGGGGGGSALNRTLNALTFNGATTTFNLAIGATAVTPATAASLLILINGVVQQPEVAYTVTGSQITFSVAPAATDTFFGVYLAGAAAVFNTPAPITANQNNYALSVGANQIRLSSDAARTITGFVAEAGSAAALHNVGSFPITIAHESTSSVAANRVISPTGADITIPANGAITITYDATTARWRASSVVRSTIEAWWAASADKTKLDGIATGATANATDAQLRDRTTHTGVQPISSVDGLQSALDAKQPSGSYAAAVHTHTISATTGLQAALDAKQPSGSYAATVHSHVIADTSGLQAALDSKQAAGAYAASTHTHTISAVVGLQTALDQKQEAGAYATLVGGKVPAAQLPSFVDDVIEVDSTALLPTAGEEGKIYIAVNSGKVYRWAATQYVEIVASPGSTDVIAEGTTNLYFTTGRAAAAAPVQQVAGRTGSVTLDVADVANAVSTTDARLSNARTPTAHQHVVGDVTGLQAALDAKQPAGSYASASHTHTASQITDFTSAVVAAAPVTSVNGQTGAVTVAGGVTSVNGQTGAVSLNAANVGAASVSHAHSASAIESGIIDPARLATGTANSTTYLRGDSTWATVTSGSTNAGDLTSGTLGFQRLPSRVRVATNMYLWNTFR